MKRLKKPSGRKTIPSRLGLFAKRMLVAMAVILPVALGIAIWLVFFTDACAIEDVVITGTRHLSSKRVLEISGVGDYKNLVTLPVGRVAANLESDPWIKDAKIGRRLPGTVIIGVVERKPLAVVDCYGVGFVVDDSGYVISGASGEEVGVLPRINARDATPPEVGGPLKDGSTRDGVRALAALGEKVRATITDVESAKDDSLVFASKEGFKILFGGPDQLEKKSDVLEAVLEDVKKNERAIEYMDVRVPDSPVIMPK